MTIHGLWTNMLVPKSESFFIRRSFCRAPYLYFFHCTIHKSTCCRRKENNKSSRELDKIRLPVLRNNSYNNHILSDLMDQEFCAYADLPLPEIIPSSYPHLEYLQGSTQPRCNGRASPWGNRLLDHG